MSEILTVNSTFFFSLATMAFAFLSGALAYTIRSKCSSVKCCGCIEIIRDIDAEVELEEQITPPIQSNSNTPEYNETCSSTRRNSQRNNNLIQEAIKQLKRKSDASDTEVIDFRKSMTNNI